MIPAFEPWADAWAAGVWRASWQGAIVVAVAWAIHRWCTFLSPRVLCWVWRLACLKLFVALCWSQPLELALLPAEVRPAPVRAAALRVMPPAFAEIDVAAPGQRPQPALALPADPPRQLSWPIVLLPLWVIGASLCVARTAQQWIGVRRLLQPGGQVVTDRLLVMCREEAARLGLHRLPRLHMAEGVDSPLLVGVWGPTILLPAGCELRFDESELRMMLAHELAHQARRDLVWNWLPTVAGWLFFFHPMAWLLVRRWSEAQEAACDELLIQRQAARTTDLGRLLVKLAATAGNTPAALTAPGVLGAYQNLERRIISMARVKPFSVRRLAVAGSLAALVGVTAIVPWRLVAQELAIDRPARGAGARLGADEPAQRARPITDDEGGTERTVTANGQAEGQGIDAATNRTIARLRELGVEVDIAEGKQRRFHVNIDLSYTGTTDELTALLKQLPSINMLFVDLDDAQRLRAELAEKVDQKRASPKLLETPLKTVDPTFLNSLELQQPLPSLIIQRASAAALAKIERLPSRRQLMLHLPDLSQAGWERLAHLAQGTHTLQIDGKQSPTDKSSAILNDTILEYVGRIESLQSVMLFSLDITDAGLPQLAKLKQLRLLGVSGCPEVHGAGLSDLSQLPSLRQLLVTEVPLDGEGLRAIGRLEHLQSLTLHSATINPADAGSLAALKNLRSLIVSVDPAVEPTAENIATGDALFRAAGQLPKLERLHAEGFAVGDDGLTRLATATSLERLSAGPVTATERGLQALAALRSLKSLTIFGSAVTDARLAALADLESLDELQLNGAAIDGAGTAKLARLKKLKSLSLSHSQVNDAGCQALAVLAPLENLDLAHTKVTDAGLANLARLENLRSLTLDENEISLAGLTPLAALKKLRQISIVGVPATKDEIAALQTRFPGVTIQNEPVLGLQVYMADAMLDGEEQEKAAPDQGDQGAAQRALERLKNLGAFPATEKQIGIQGDWKGTDADLALINDLPEVDWLYIDLERHGGSGLAKLDLKRTIEFVSLDALSDEILAKVDRLPTAKTLCLPRYRLTAVGCARLADLALGVERLELVGANSGNPIADDGLGQIAKIRSLKELEIFDGAITDAGLASLAALERLEVLELIDCWNVRGPGYESLANIKSLRTLKIHGARIDANAVKALATLKQLKTLRLQPTDELAAADTAQLRAALPDANTSVTSNKPQETNGVLVVEGQDPEKVLRAALPGAEISITPSAPEGLGFFVVDGPSSAATGVIEGAFSGDDPEEARRRLWEALPEQKARAQTLANSAEKWMRRGEFARAKADFEETLALTPANVPLAHRTSCNLAWLLATCPDDNIRDGKRAVELATKACEGFSRHGAQPKEAIDTLAAAHAEAGDFAAAVKWQSEAIRLAGGNEAFKKGAEERLALYRQQKAYREQPQAAAPANDRGAQGSQSLSFTPAPGGLAAPVQTKSQDTTVAHEPDVKDSDLSDGHTVQYTETRTNRLRDGRQTAGLIRRVKVLGRFLMREEMKHTPGEGQERGDTNSYVHIIDAVQITNARKGVLLVLSPDSKSYEYVKEIFGITGDGEVVTSKPEPLPNVDYYRQMRDVPLETATKLNDQFIDGKAANGFEVVKKIEKPQGTDTWTRKYYVDPKTKLPLRVEVSFRSTDPDRGESDWVQSDIVFDEKLEPELFSTKAPEGYKEVVRN